MSGAVDGRAVATHDSDVSEDHVANTIPRAASFRARSNYFLEGDIVWVRPVRLPYWPAEVICSDERRNRVRARLIDPPHPSLLQDNLAHERRLCAPYTTALDAQEARVTASGGSCGTVGADDTGTADVVVAAAAMPQTSGLTQGSNEEKDRPASRRRTEATPSCPVREEPTPPDSAVPLSSATCSRLSSRSLPPPTSPPLQQNGDPSPSPLLTCCWTALDADVVTTSGQSAFFFDKLRTVAEIETCIEERLQRRCHDVSAYETDFHSAVHHANRLVRVAVDPNRMLPYTICAVGVVHSLMRSHISAPRQPHTSTFVPQTAVIKLRRGLENALRDLRGFEYIWVIFQFSYSAARATGEGQQCIAQLHEPSAQASGCTSAAIMPCRSLALDDKEGVPDVKAPSHTVAKGAAVDEEILSTWRRRQGATSSSGYKLMLVPPRDEELRGVFATRSPHRPNFIGMSCVRLVSVRGLEVHIADHDLLHGTPVLDIKPYLPFCDSHPHARTGWVEQLDSTGRGKGDHKSSTQVKRVDRVMEDY